MQLLLVDDVCFVESSTRACGVALRQVYGLAVLKLYESNYEGGGIEASADGVF